MKSKMPKRLKRNTIYESEWIALYADRVRMPDGSIIDPYHKLHYPHEFVSIVIYNEKGETLLIQSKRYVTESLEWEVPAGRVEADEKPESAARRECQEETGCTIKDLTYLCFHNPSNGMSDQKVHIFAAKVDAEGKTFDENEVNCRRWFRKDEVEVMLKCNKIHCGISILALLYAERFYQNCT